MLSCSAVAVSLGYLALNADFDVSPVIARVFT